MKHILLSLLSMIILLSACTSGEDRFIEGIETTFDNEDGVFTYTMTMNEDAKPLDEYAQTRS